MMCFSFIYTEESEINFLSKFPDAIHTEGRKLGKILALDEYCKGERPMGLFMHDRVPRLRAAMVPRPRTRGPSRRKC
jgi:hypothetical protein